MLQYRIWFVILLFFVLQMSGIIDAYAVREYNNVVLVVSTAIFLLNTWYEVRPTESSQKRKLILPGLIYVICGTVEVVNFETEWLDVVLFYCIIVSMCGKFVDEMMSCDSILRDKNNERSRQIPCSCLDNNKSFVIPIKTIVKNGK